MAPEINKVDEGDKYYHVRVRDPDDYENIRTLTDPDEDGRVKAARDAGAHGIKVGKDKESGTWRVQSVLVKMKGNTERSSKRAARRTVDSLED